MQPEKPNLLQPEKISIVKTAIVRCSTESPFGFDVEKALGHDFNMDFKLGFNLKDKLVKADFTIDISTKSDGGNEVEAKGSFHFVYVFHVENLDELAKPDKSNGIDLNLRLGNALASITYSTTRGILFARLGGTSLENFVLPVIDPNKLLNS